ncbi:MAG: hypothetical protein R3F11_21100 [Verrucomicrobiales bacterium]
MKTTLSIALAVLMSAGFASAKKFRTLTSKDGSKKMEAAVTNVFAAQDGMTIEIERKDNGRRYKVPAASFSDEDQEYFKGVAEVMALGSRLSVQITPLEDRGETQESGGRKIVDTTSSYQLSLRNNGKVDLTDFTVKYTIFYQKDQRDGQYDSKRAPKEVSGEIDVKKLVPQSEKIESTDYVSIVSDRPNRGGPG